MMQLLTRLSLWCGHCRVKTYDWDVPVPIGGCEFLALAKLVLQGVCTGIVSDLVVGLRRRTTLTSRSWT